MQLGNWATFWATFYFCASMLPFSIKASYQLHTKSCFRQSDLRYSDPLCTRLFSPLRLVFRLIRYSNARYSVPRFSVRLSCKRRLIHILKLYQQLTLILKLFIFISKLKQIQIVKCCAFNSRAV